MPAARPLRVDLGDQIAKEINTGVQATFINMFGIKPDMAPYWLEKECSVVADVSGIISLTQDKLDGTLIVSFPKQTIFGILEKMYKKPFTEVNQSVKAGVGELTNIIYGVVKANLNKDGFSFKMALPNVVIGEQHTVLTCESGQTMVVPFKTNFGDFHIRISFNQ